MHSQRIFQRVIPFASKVGVRNVGDIKKDSFENYPTFYRKVETKGKWSTTADGLSVSTINSDVTTINELMNWMIKRNLLDSIAKFISSSNISKSCNDSHSW